MTIGHTRIAAIMGLAGSDHVEQALCEMAVQAARPVSALSRGAEPISRRMDRAVRLIERSSTAPAVGVAVS